MLADISPEELAEAVTEEVLSLARFLASALNARLGRPNEPRVAHLVGAVTAYAQRGADERPHIEIANDINQLIELLSRTAYHHTTHAARAIFDRKAGEPETQLDLVLLAARARSRIELGMPVPIRWLAALGGVSVKTARNLASERRIVTSNTSEGQAATAADAATWLKGRGVAVTAATRAEKAVRKRGTRTNA
jgi:hypothetical protein